MKRIAIILLAGCVITTVFGMDKHEKRAEEHYRRSQSTEIPKAPVDASQETPRPEVQNDYNAACPCPKKITCKDVLKGIWVKLAQSTQFEKDMLLKRILQESENDPLDQWNCHRCKIAASVCAGADIHQEVERARETLYNDGRSEKHLYSTNALARAVRIDDVNLAGLLLEHGAAPNHLVGRPIDNNLNSIFPQGRPVFVFAISKTMAQLLKQHGSNYKKYPFELLASAMKWDKDSELLKFYLEHALDVNAVKRGNLSALHMLAMFWCPDYSDIKQLEKKAQMLLQAGADPNLKDKRGRTALYFAERNSECMLINTGCQRLAEMLREAMRQAH